MEVEGSYRFYCCSLSNVTSYPFRIRQPKQTAASRNEKVENVGGSAWIRPAPSHFKSKVVNTTHPVKDGNTLGFTHYQEKQS